jgi:hypothetical protein
MVFTYLKIIKHYLLRPVCVFLKVIFSFSAVNLVASIRACFFRQERLSLIDRVPKLIRHLFLCSVIFYLNYIFYCF